MSDLPISRGNKRTSLFASVDLKTHPIPNQNNFSSSSASSWSFWELSFRNNSLIREFEAAYFSLERLNMDEIEVFGRTMSWNTTLHSHHTLEKNMSPTIFTHLISICNRLQWAVKSHVNTGTSVHLCLCLCLKTSYL